MNKKRTKAFTLTELLVVVIVLGVLAAVAVPKFTRVLETRRTTEAENMLSAVRTEQEKRCSLGQNYTGDFGKIQTVAYAKTGQGRAQTANYIYTLTATGASASREGKEYVLKMPSYKSGEICCEGAGCEALNKSYPLCSEVTVEVDECAATDVVMPVPEPEPSGPCDVDPDSCECNPNQSKCCTADEEWNGSACVDKETPSEPETPVCEGSSSRSCGCGSNPSEVSGEDLSQTLYFGIPPSRGRQTRTCINGVWSDWSDCSGYTKEAGVQCHGKNWEWTCVYNSSSDSWSWRVDSRGTNCDFDPSGGNGGGSSSGGGNGGSSSCTWKTVATYMCGIKVPQSACNGYSQCSINDYCPGGGIRVEACI